MQTVIILTLFVATAYAASTGYTYTPPDKSFATIEPVKTLHTHTSTKTSKNSGLIESIAYKKESGASGHLPTSGTTTKTIVNKVAFKPLKTVQTNTIPIGADVVYKSTGFSANSNVATVERGADGAKAAETVVENVVVEPANTVRSSSVVTGAGESVGATGILAASKVNTRSGTVFNAGGTGMKTSKGAADNVVSNIISTPVVSASAIVSSTGLVRPEELTNAESTVHSSTVGNSGVVSHVLDIPIVTTSKLTSTGNTVQKTSGGNAGVIPKIVSTPIVSTGGLLTSGSTVLKTSGGNAGVIPKIVSTPIVSTGGLLTSGSTVRKTSGGSASVIPNIVSTPIVSTGGLITTGSTVLKTSGGSASVIPNIVSTPIVSIGGLLTSGSTVRKTSGGSASVIPNIVSTPIVSTGGLLTSGSTVLKTSGGSASVIPNIVSTPIVSTGGLVNSGSLVRLGGLTNLGNPVLQTTGGNYGVGAEFLRTPLVSTNRFVSSGNTVLQSNGPNSGATVNRVLQVDANALLNSVPQTVEYNKQFFHFSAPEEDESESITTQQLSNVLKKNLQVVFITAPENNAATNAALQIAKQAIEQKSSIYVLSKQNDASQVVAQLEQVQENVPTSPEVRVVKYRTPQDAAHAIDEIQSQYNHFGGTSEVHNGGVAPVLNYASPALATYTSGNFFTGGSRLSEVNKVASGLVPVGQSLSPSKTSGDTYLPVPL